ncbi:protein PFC0760c-like [Mizuhopecten yessoensis]|uniref:protein PFC0760c-like n=1 Tax=Mizuhopecten yessoensis TaxID=6573 RepID=UPI000B45C7F3|nr:protein PFC0760c-like [Mizuhopecten yessoensis]
MSFSCCFHYHDKDDDEEEEDVDDGEDDDDDDDDTEDVDDGMMANTTKQAGNDLYGTDDNPISEDDKEKLKESITVEHIEVQERQTMQRKLDGSATPQTHSTEDDEPEKFPCDGTGVISSEDRIANNNSCRQTTDEHLQRDIICHHTVEVDKQQVSVTSDTPSAGSEEQFDDTSTADDDGSEKARHSHDQSEKSHYDHSEGKLFGSETDPEKGN